MATRGGDILILLQLASAAASIEPRMQLAAGTRFETDAKVCDLPRSWGGRLAPVACTLLWEHTATGGRPASRSDAPGIRDRLLTLELEPAQLSSCR